MKNEFKLTQDVNMILIKIFKTVLAVIFAYLCFGYAIHSAIHYSYLMIIVIFFCIMLLYLLKHYKVIGKITIDSDSIFIKENNSSLELPFTSILKIRYYVIPKTGRSYVPTFFKPIGVKVTHGTGNVLEIETINKNYKFDILLQSSIETNSLKFHINRLALLGLNIEKIKLGSLLGDHL